MSWKIGSIQFPVPPQRITKKNKTVLKKFNVGVEAPWIYYMGADAKQLSLDGEFFDSSRYGSTHKSGIYSDYIEKLEKYTERDMAIIMPFLNIAPTGTWKSGTTITTFKETGDKYVKNNESLYVVFGSSNRNIYYEYDDPLDFSKYNLVGIWAYGTGSEKFSLTFYNEAYASKTNGYRQWVQASGTEWVKRLFVMSSIDGSVIFQNVGTPTGWDSIRTIVISPSGAFNPGAQGYRFDAGIIGVGHEVTSPGGYYDGVWLVDTFQYEEDGAKTEDGFRYRMQLIDTTEAFGKESKVVG